MSYRNRGHHVFVLGSARSGTSLMASIIQGTKDFASYRAETKLLNSCPAVYGGLNNKQARSKFWRDWYRSRQFFRSGLTKQEVSREVEQLHSYIAILGTYMDLVAKRQNRNRWVDSTPSNANHIRQISMAFPNAKVIHMVRDGRAVSLSLAKLGWSGVRTEDFDIALLFSALKWQQVVEKVYESKHCLGGRYLEVSYELLIRSPDKVLKQVSEFLQIPLLDSGCLSGESESVNSSLRTPNSPFGDMDSGLSSNAMYRWKTVLTDHQVAMVNAYINATLIKTGYQCQRVEKLTFLEKLLLKWRKASLKAKSKIKNHTILGRLAVSPLEYQLDSKSRADC